ncbi:MAG: hypothetical protein F6K54_12155 [Okeania sp. SIO3B5]|nr:hypothetical protein [Okeania sp. SIO3B5]NEO53767.1 hypothetical protein [Okeania sp. SIO3B5]
MLWVNGDRYANKMTEATFRNSSQEVNRTFIISSRDIAAALAPPTLDTV